MSVCAQKVRLCLAEKDLAYVAKHLNLRKPYQSALAEWFNPKYLPLMDEKGSEAWPRVKELLAA